MWKQYKKTAAFMQAGIFLTCVGVYFATGRQLIAVLYFFLVMQVAAVLGAAWGASLKYRRERGAQRRDELPLERRR
jgi:hypothetical protein